MSFLDKVNLFCIFILTCRLISYASSCFYSHSFVCFSNTHLNLILPILCSISYPYPFPLYAHLFLIVKQAKMGFRIFLEETNFCRKDIACACVCLFCCLAFNFLPLVKLYSVCVFVCVHARGLACHFFQSYFLWQLLWGLYFCFPAPSSTATSCNNYYEACMFACFIFQSTYFIKAPFV